jgi:hypothetical protein
MPDAQFADQLVNSSYTAFAAAVDLYDCRIRYSLWTCNDCKSAYAAWLCSKMYKPCVNETTLETCRDTCFDGMPSVSLPCHCLTGAVVRMCPPNIDFSCPLTGSDYVDPPAACNSFGRPLLSSAAGRSVPAMSMSLVLVVVALLVSVL